MGFLRRMPLFARIWLMWWLLLAAYGPSRPLVGYQLFARGSGPLDLLGSFQPPSILWLVSIGHALIGSWIAVRVLLRFDRGGRRAAARWTVALIWFAIGTWFIVYHVIGAYVGRYPFEVHRLLDALYIPLVALWALPAVTWIVVPLAIATVLMVRRSKLEARLPAESAAGA